MICFKTTFLVLLVFAFTEIHQCGRYGGSRSSSRSGGSHHTSVYRPSHSSSSFGSYRPRPSPPPRYPSATSRPRPVQTHVTYSPSSRPREPVVSVTQRPVQSSHGIRSTYRPQYPSHTTRRPVYAATTPRRYITTARATWNNLPPKPGSHPIGPSYSHPSYSGPQKVKIVNKYNYHYPGYYSMPVHTGYPGYFYTPSYYNYRSSDTGSTALGFFLGYSFSRLTTPTYSHYSFYDGYRPHYDHYTIHHYYHNRETVPQRQEIPANTIVGCVGDSASVCPANTVSLCTSSGALMCVANVVATVPCKDNNNLKCVTSTISCVNNTAPECKNSQDSATVNIPCVSNAEVRGDVKYVNNTIVAANATAVGLPVNTNGTSTSNTTVTTPQGPVSTRRKREAQQNFCVAVLALPAKREPTEGEEFLKDAMFLTGKFVENAWNL